MMLQFNSDTDAAANIALPLLLIRYIIVLRDVHQGGRLEIRVCGYVHMDSYRYGNCEVYSHDRSMVW